MFPPNTPINLEATIPVYADVNSWHPHFAVGSACLYGGCIWTEPRQIRGGGFFRTDPNRSELLITLPYIEIATEASAGWNYRDGSRSFSHASITIDFGHMTLIEGHCGENGCMMQDLTNVVPFSVARFDPEIPSPEPGAFWLAASGLIASLVARRFRSKHR